MFHVAINIDKNILVNCIFQEINAFFFFGGGGVFATYLSFLYREDQKISIFGLGVHTHSMETIYLSLRAQVAEGIFFMKSPV